MTQQQSPSLSSVLVAVLAAFVLLLSCSAGTTHALNPTGMAGIKTLSSRNTPRGFAMDVDDKVQGGCRVHTTEASCAQAKACEWCVSAAVPASCYSSKAAARLPAGVFQCK